MDETGEQVAVVGAVGMNFVAVRTLIMDLDDRRLERFVLDVLDFEC